MLDVANAQQHLARPLPCWITRRLSLAKHSLTSLCLYRAVRYPSLLSRHFAIPHSSLAMQVNSFLFSTEQYHDITILVSAMPLQHLTLQFLCLTLLCPTSPLRYSSLQHHSATTLRFTKPLPFRAIQNLYGTVLNNALPLLDFFPSKWTFATIAPLQHAIESTIV